VNIRPGCRPAEVSIARLREVLVLDSINGRLTWKFSKGNKAAGKEAGCIKNDAQSGRPRLYRSIRVDGVLMLAHRVVVAMTTGAWPTDEIDHKDGDGLNNAPSNLRVVDRKVNAQNQKCLNTNSSSGLRGVSRFQGKWRARIQVNGKEQSLGLYKSPSEARNAYLMAKAKVHPGYVRQEA
jgi:hypothetical protein